MMFSKFRNKNILVTGGAGFIGSHLCEKLVGLGFNVVCLDNLDGYYDPKIKKRNIRSLLKHKNFVFLKQDIRDPGLIDGLFKKNKFGSIIHLAAKAGVRPSIDSPLEYADVNIIGTMVLLEACRKYKVKRLVFASSSSVYGKTEKKLFSESDAADRPMSPYGATKRAGELMCYAYHHLFGINTACLRFFTVYGPRQRPDLAIHKFSILMASGKAIPIYGDGTSKRDYTYVGDIVEGILSSMNLLERSKSPVFEIINLGRSKPVYLNDLILELEKSTNFRAKTQRLKDQAGDLPHTFADIRKARKVLSFDPKTSFKSGMDKFAKWYLSETNGEQC